MKYILIIVGLVLAQNFSFGQGLNHQWLLGNYNFIQDPKGRIYITNNNYTVTTEYRKMPFKGTQGNISDKNGNLLMSSNGYWIANALNDTMMNGSGINPGGITPNWPYGLPLVANNMFIPFPGDSTRYILLHHSRSDFNGTYSPVNILYQTQVDITLDSGLGEIILKNDTILNDTLNGGIGACKHANGRDWWVVMHKDSSDIIFTILINDSGITSISTQHLYYLPLPWGSFSQLVFSPNGIKFCATTYDPSNLNSFIVLADFDRCTGLFSNIQTIQLTNNSALLGLAFSTSGKYVYACSSNNLFQIDTDSLTYTTVATYDGFISPGPSCCNTSFWNMYLAANGKIYVTSGSSVQHLHEINYPDSAGLSCDVQQHAIDLQDYLHLRAVPNHPNYYLGCDTTLGCPCLIPPTGIDEQSNEFNLNIFPNPTTNKQFNISYLLPQNKNGIAEIYDINGKLVYTKVLPPWSTLQQFNLSHLSEGIYAVKLTSGESSVVKKVVLRE